jgi:hypothetical protein
MAGRLATIGLFMVSSGMVYLLDTAKDAFDVILQVGAGTGLLYLVRWFWWRVNAWCEVVAMVSSFVVSLGLLVMAKAGSPVSTHKALLFTVAVTTLCWVITAYVGPQTDRRVLIDFYKRVKPAGPGWTEIREAAGLTNLPRTHDENVPLALLGWAAGSMMIWSALFSVGNYLYGRYLPATLLAIVFAVTGATVIWVMKTLWPASEEAMHEHPTGA